MTSAGKSVASATMTTSTTSTTVTVTSARKGQRCHREHAHHCQNCQFRFYNFALCYFKNSHCPRSAPHFARTLPLFLSFAHSRFEYRLRIGRIAASQQSWMELELRLSRRLQRANVLDC